MTDIIEPTYDDVLGAIKRLTALAQLESDPPAITKAMIWAYLHGQRDPLRPEGMTADLSTAIDELQALVALIERQPLDDVQLSQSVAMQTAAHIRTLIAFVPAELVFLRRFYDDWKTGKSDSHLRDAADAFEDTGGVIGDPVASAPAGDGVEDRYDAGYSQGTIDAGQQHQWMQDKAWQDAVLMLVHYSTLAERTWLIGHEDAARKLAEWWGHARALADTKTADEIAALARPRAAVGEWGQAAMRTIYNTATNPGRTKADMETALSIIAATASTALQSPPAKVEEA